MSFSADSFLPYRGGAVYTTDEGYLYHINTKGKLDWGFKQLDENILLQPGPEYLCAYGGNKLQVISHYGALVLTKLFDGEILSVRSSSKYISATYMSADGTVVLDVLSSTGQHLESITFLSSQKLMDFGFSEAGDQLWVLSIEEAAMPVYHVEIHRFDPSHTLNASLTIDTEAIYSVIINKDGVFLTGTKSVRKYNSVNQLVEQIPIFGKQLLCASGSSKVATHIISTVDPPYSLLKVLQNGKEKANIVLSPSSTSVVYANNNIYSICGNKMYRYSITGKKTATYRLPHFVDDVVVLPDEGFVFLISGNSVSLLKLP